LIIVAGTIILAFFLIMVLAAYQFSLSGEFVHP
jgi:hypothetical protein